MFFLLVFGGCLALETTARFVCTLGFWLWRGIAIVFEVLDWEDASCSGHLYICLAVLSIWWARCRKLCVLYMSACCWWLCEMFYAWAEYSLEKLNPEPNGRLPMIIRCMFGCVRSGRHEMQNSTHNSPRHSEIWARLFRVCVSFFSYSYIVNFACRDYTPNTVGRAIKCAQVDLVYSPTTACRGDPREHKRRWSKNASMYIHILQHSNMRFLRLYVSLKSFFLSRRVFSVFTTCRVCRTGCSAWVTLN